MKNREQQRQGKATGVAIKVLSRADLAKVNGGMMSPANCNALLLNHFYISYNKFCTG